MVSLVVRFAEDLNHKKKHETCKNKPNNQVNQPINIYLCNSVYICFFIYKTTPLKRRFIFKISGLSASAVNNRCICSSSRNLTV